MLCSIYFRAQNYVTITDPNFASFLKTNYASCMNGNQLDTTCAEINNTVNLNLRSYGLMANIYGIQFFKKLQTLNCGGIGLETLEPLPPTLQNLYCDSNKLVTLPVLPLSLISLSCSENELVSLPSLPAQLDYLYCRQNKLQDLPTLPKNLSYLYCSGNLLKTLPQLPDTLQTLKCDRNQLTALPKLSNALITLTCSGNQLTVLPPLPARLKDLDCSNNQLTGLPPYSSRLMYLSCSKNKISCFEMFPNFFTISIEDNPFKCLPNYIQAMDAATLNYPLCESGDKLNNPGGCVAAIRISGTIFNDTNGDCKKDPADPNTVNLPLKLYDSSNKLIGQTYSNLKGEYEFYVSTEGSYKVVVDTAGFPIVISCPYPGIDSVVYVTSWINPTINFSVLCKPGFDIGVQSIIPRGRIFPGNQHRLIIAAGDITSWNKLYCKMNTGGIVKVIVDGPVKFEGPAAGALIPTVSGHSYTYTISDFSTINLNSLILEFTMNTTANAKDSICVLAVVTPVAGDNNPTNNIKQFCYKVFNSYDPNLKEVYPFADVKEGFSDWLTYTIHFQNTGNAPAQNIVLTDTLDTDLNPETFQVLNYSHPNQTSLKGYALNVKFPDINLADSTSDPEGSKGFIQYRIKPKANLAAGTTILNHAFIYFDYNAPVITNTTVNEFFKPVSVTENTIDEILIYPNPGKGLFHLEATDKLHSSNLNASVCNVLGKVVWNAKITSGNVLIDLNELPNGVYFLRVVSADKSFTQRLIKQ